MASREIKKTRYNELIKKGLSPSEALLQTDREFGEGYEEKKFSESTPQKSSITKPNQVSRPKKLHEKIFGAVKSIGEFGAQLNFGNDFDMGYATQNRPQPKKQGKQKHQPLQSKRYQQQQQQRVQDDFTLPDFSMDFPFSNAPQQKTQTKPHPKQHPKKSKGHSKNIHIHIS